MTCPHGLRAAVIEHRLAVADGLPDDECMERAITAYLDRRQPEETHLVNGPLVVDLASCRVTLHGKSIELWNKEYQLLCFLMRHKGEAIPHRRILVAVWGAAHADDIAYLRVYIGQLRRRLDPLKSRPQLIECVTERGYRLENLEAAGD